MMIQTRLVEPAELLSVGRLRYERFVVERGCPLPYADHTNRTVVEPLDGIGSVIGAFDADRLVGTVRFSTGLAPEYAKLYRVRDVPDSVQERVSVTSRLVTTLDASADTARKLAVACFHTAAAVNVWLSFIDCNRRLEPFFVRMGFLRVGERVEDPVFGSIQPLLLILPDAPRFERIRSPFAHLSKAAYSAADRHQARGLVQDLVGDAVSLPIDPPPRATLAGEAPHIS